MVKQVFSKRSACADAATTDRSPTLLPSVLEGGKFVPQGRTAADEGRVAQQPPAGRAGSGAWRTSICRAATCRSHRLRALMRRSNWIRCAGGRIPIPADPAVPSVVAPIALGDGVLGGSGLVAPTTRPVAPLQRASWDWMGSPPTPRRPTLFQHRPTGTADNCRVHLASIAVQTTRCELASWSRGGESEMTLPTGPAVLCSHPSCTAGPENRAFSSITKAHGSLSPEVTRVCMRSFLEREDCCVLGNR
jgi:hypothetical protein